MSRTFCGVPFRINALILLYMNFIWNTYVVGAYLFAIYDSGGSTITHVGNGFPTIMLVLSILSLIYLGAIITIHKKEFYMLSPTIATLILDSFCLMYFYARIISLDLMITWQNMAYQGVTFLPWEFLRTLVEQCIMALLLAVLSVPLSFKILSVLILRWYKEKLKKSSFVLLPSFSEAILHFSPPPPYDEYANKEDICECPPPPYSRHYNSVL